MSDKPRFRYNKPTNVILIHEDGWDYEIDLDGITPMGLCKWTRHMAEKDWWTREDVITLIDMVCKIEGWVI